MILLSHMAWQRSCGGILLRDKVLWRIQNNIILASGTLVEMARRLESTDNVDQSISLTGGLKVARMFRWQLRTS